MYSTRQLLSDLWQYIRHHRVKFIIATILRIIADVTWLYMPYAIGSAVEFLSHYTAGDSFSPLFWPFALFFPILFYRHFGVMLAKFMVFRISETVMLDAETAGVNHMAHLDMEWHEKFGAGNKFKRLDRGADSLRKILRMWINEYIEIAISVVGIFIIIFRFDIGIGAAVSVFLFVYYLMSAYFRKRAVAAAEVSNKMEEDRSGLLFESINNVRTVKILTTVDSLLKDLQQNSRNMMVYIMRRVYWFQTGNNIRNFVAQCFRYGTLIFIGYGITKGHYSVGFFVMFNGYFVSAWQSVSSFTDISEEFAIARTAVGRMQEIIRTPLTIDIEKGKKRFPKNWQTISFQDVSFSYENNQVLKNISFTIKRGERIGIIGLSGAGKSTLFKLLLKERESYTGEILVDSIPLREISKRQYFDYATAVLQETELFDNTLRKNIVMSDLSQQKNQALLKRSLEISHVKDFIGKLPDGVETLIGEKGMKLSGGEKQRVGLARAVFKRPQILLLDEATSHLDVESEEKIQDSLHKFFQKVTAVVIAHRLSTIKEMDRILVMEDGQIIEEGSFTELYDQQGRFFELWEKQKLS